MNWKYCSVKSQVTCSLKMSRAMNHHPLHSIDRLLDLSELRQHLANC